MYCNQCGQQIEDGSRFCRHCGAPQQTVAVGPDGMMEPAFESPQSIPDIGKPASSTGRNIGIGAAALLGLIYIGSLDSSNTDQAATANSAEAIADNLEAQAGNLEAVANAAEKPASDGVWSYSTDVDKVRGGTSYFASTTSTNTVHQDSPYDAETSMHMTVRQMPSSGTDVVLTISSGQMMCPSYEGCSGTVRFDNGPAQRISFNGPADNSSETIFVEGARSFVGKLRKAKKVIIEKTLYQAGNPQFEFDVAGLKWDR